MVCERTGCRQHRPLVPHGRIPSRARHRRGRTRSQSAEILPHDLWCMHEENQRGAGDGCQLSQIIWRNQSIWRNQNHLRQPAFRQHNCRRRIPRDVRPAGVLHRGGRQVRLHGVADAGCEEIQLQQDVPQRLHGDNGQNGVNGFNGRFEAQL